MSDIVLRSTADLNALKGWGPAGIRRATRDQLISKVRRGRYADGPPLPPHEAHRARVLATAPLLADGSVVSHVSAAILHALPVPVSHLSQVWITRRAGHGTSTPTLRALRAELPAEHVASIGGIPVTSLARTVVDVARTMPFEWGVAAADAALRRGVSRGEVLAALDLRRRPGNNRARRVLTFADALAESPGESISRALFELEGVPRPELQVEVRTASGVFVGRGDFGWREARVLGEFDGAVKYDALVGEGRRPSDVVMAEKRREQALQDEDWWVIRWGWRELAQPTVLADRIRRALARR